LYKNQQGLLEKFHRILNPGGPVLLDVYSLSAFEEKSEVATYQANLLNGFWSPNKYYGFLNTFKYHEENVSVDKYTIIESDPTREVVNWLQYFAPEDLFREFMEAGLSVKGIYADVAGAPYDRTSMEFAAIADRA